jgi:hypothetical protein
MTIVSLYPTKASPDQPAKAAPIDPANAGTNNNIKYYVTPFKDAGTLLSFVHDFQELICLKGVTEDYEQQVQVGRLLLQDDALEKLNGNYVDPVIALVDQTAANDVQEARPINKHSSTALLKGY